MSRVRVTWRVHATRLPFLFKIDFGLNHYTGGGIQGLPLGATRWAIGTRRMAVSRAERCARRDARRHTTSEVLDEGTVMT